MADGHRCHDYNADVLSRQFGKHPSFRIFIDAFFVFTVLKIVNLRNRFDPFAQKFATHVFIVVQDEMDQKHLRLGFRAEGAWLHVWMRDRNQRVADTFLKTVVLILSFLLLFAEPLSEGDHANADEDQSDADDNDEKDAIVTQGEMRNNVRCWYGTSRSRDGFAHVCGTDIWHFRMTVANRDFSVGVNSAVRMIHMFDDYAVLRVLS